MTFTAVAIPTSIAVGLGTFLAAKPVLADAGFAFPDWMTNSAVGLVIIGGSLLIGYLFKYVKELQEKQLAASEAHAEKFAEMNRAMIESQKESTETRKYLADAITKLAGKQ